MKRISKVSLFLLITFAASYSMAGAFFLLGGDYKSVWGTVLAICYMFIPMATVLLIEKVVYKERIKERLRLSFNFNIWFLLAILIPLVLVFITFGLSLLLPDISFSPDMSGMIKRMESSLSPEQVEQMKVSFRMIPVHPAVLGLINGIIGGLTINAIAGFGEELGWRGFLLRELSGKSFAKVSLFIGVIWGVWHAPIILMGHNYPQHPQFGVFMMIVWCTLLSFVFNYVTLKTKSVIAASVLHGVLNGTAGVAIMLIDGGNDLTVGVTGYTGFIALLILLLLIYIFDTWISKEKIMTQRIP